MNDLMNKLVVCKEYIDDKRLICIKMFVFFKVCFFVKNFKKLRSKIILFNECGCFY